MKQKTITLLVALLISCANAFAQSSNEPLKGDVNGDGQVDIGDIVAVIDILRNVSGTAVREYFYLGTTQPKAENYQILPGVLTTYNSIDNAVGSVVSVGVDQMLYMLCPRQWMSGKSLAMVDGVGNIADFSDVIDTTSIAGYLISKTQVFTEAKELTLIFKTPGETIPAETHEAVDLGLSVKWATTNVGASKPVEFGDFFAWGETTPKDNYSASTYKWCKGTSKTITKYCTWDQVGTVDNKKVLEKDDDAAYANWGGTWRMPTFDEIDELSTKCTWTWTVLDNVSGYKVTGPNGNSIFLPAAGYRSGAKHNNVSTYGYYWSTKVNTAIPTLAYCILFREDYRDWYRTGNSRFDGYNVRPVSE